MDSLVKYASDRTSVVRNEVVLEVQKTLLFGFLKVWRWRIYIQPNPQATIDANTPTTTFRTVSIGPVRFSYQLPVFVENWLSR